MSGSKIIRGTIVRGGVEKTLNALLDAEADRLVGFEPFLDAQGAIS